MTILSGKSYGPEIERPLFERRVSIKLQEYPFKLKKNSWRGNPNERTMKRVPQIESGLQLLSRLSKRPLLEGLDSILFDCGPFAQQTVEISGNVSSGKTLLLTQLIAKCILPSSYDSILIQGCGVSVILINTDHHFRITKLVQIMHNIVAKACGSKKNLYSDTTIRELIIIPALEALTIVKCYDNTQFKLTINTLDNILMKDPRIGLIALDSISSFYWQDRDLGGPWLIDQYMKNILKVLQPYIFQNKIVMIYTRPDDFVSRTQSCATELAQEPTVEKISYRINLSDRTRCVIKTTQGKLEVRFKIDGNGITWITRK